LQVNSIGSRIKLLKRIAGAALIAACFSIFTGLIADSFRPIRADSQDVQIAITASTGSLSLTIDGSGLCYGFDAANMSLNIGVVGGSIASGCFTVIASTTNAFGYTLTIAGPPTGQLATDYGQVINPVLGTLDHPILFTAQPDGGLWGFAVPNNQIRGFDFGFDDSYTVLGSTNTVNTSRFAAVPTGVTPFSYTDEPNTSPDVYNIFIGVAAGQIMTSGTYTGTITISAIANTVNPPAISSISPAVGVATGGTMVTITCDNFMLDSVPVVFSVSIGGSPCENITVLSNTSLTCTTTVGIPGAQTVTVLTSGGPVELAGGFTYAEVLLMQEITAANCPTTRTLAVDARNNRTYWVRLIGNLCWMETNLAYAGGGNNTFGDTMPVMTQGVAAFFTAPRIYIQSGANPSTYPAFPSLATDGGVALAGRQYGYLYNWCAAMGGQTAACTANTTTGFNPSISVCPHGWRLPTGAAGGEFVTLNALVNNGLTNTDVGLRTNWLLQYSGWFTATGASSGAGALLYTSTPVGQQNASSPWIQPGSVDMTFNNTRSFGRSVRCVAD